MVPWAGTLPGNFTSASWFHLQHFWGSRLPSSHSPLLGCTAKRARSGPPFPAIVGWKANKSQSKQRSRRLQTPGHNGKLPGSPCQGETQSRKFPRLFLRAGGAPQRQALPFHRPVFSRAAAQRPPPQPGHLCSRPAIPHGEGGKEGGGHLRDADSEGTWLWRPPFFFAAQSLMRAPNFRSRGTNRAPGGGGGGDHRQARYSACRLSGRIILPPLPRASPSPAASFVVGLFYDRGEGGGCGELWSRARASSAVQAGTGPSSWPAGLVLSLLCGEVNKRPFLGRRRTCEMQL